MSIVKSCILTLSIYNNNNELGVMKNNKLRLFRDHNNQYRPKLEKYFLLARAIDVFNEPEFNFEQGLRTVLTSIKYYCNFDFVGYWSYEQSQKRFLLHSSSENLSKNTTLKCELKEQILPWSADELLSRKYVISKSKDHSIKSSGNNFKIVHEADAHFLLLIPIVINNALFGIFTFSNYKSSNAIPSNIEHELKSFSKLFSTATHRKLLIEKQYKYDCLLNIASSWKLLLKKPMPIYLENFKQINWLYKYGVISTVSKEIAHIFGYRSEKEFNEAAISLNEFIPRNKKSSIKFLLEILKNNHKGSNINSTLIDINQNEFHFRNNMESKILSGEVVSMTFQSVLFKSIVADKNNDLQPIDIIVKQKLDLLTARESEVLLYVISGSPNKLIADELGISEKTVKAHRGKIMKKLKVCCFAELVRACDHLGLNPKYTTHYSDSIMVA